MKFYVNPLYVGSTINKADINTTTGIITRTVYTTLALGAYFFNPRNSSAVRTSLPKSLQTDTVYYIGSAGLYLYKVYSDEALTTQIMFTADDVLNVTQFEIIPFGSKGYTYDRPFHAGASTLAEMMCCPPDRTRDGLAIYCHSYNSTGTLVAAMQFQSNPKGGSYGFYSGNKGDFILRGGGPYDHYSAIITTSPTDVKKIIVYYQNQGSSLGYQSASIFPEDFTGTITVSGYGSTYTLVFTGEAKVPPYAMVYLPAAKFKSPQGDISIGNIEERLAFDEPSNRYVGSVQTYYGIKGRLFLDVAFYPSPSSNIKYLSYSNTRGVGAIVNFDITRDYNDFDRPVGNLGIRGGVIPFIFNTSGVFFDSSYHFVYTSGGGSFYQDGYFTTGINYAYPEFTSTPGLTYLAVGFAEISKGTKTGYDATYNGVPADQNFRRTNVIKIVSTSVSAYVISTYSTFSTPPPMPTPTPTPTPTPKGTYLQSTPSAPEITNTSSIGNPATVSVYFSEPLNNGGARITSYQYNIDGGSWVNSNTDSPISIRGLSAGSHTVCLRAVNSIGSGASVCAEVVQVPVFTSGLTFVSKTGTGAYEGFGLSVASKLYGSLSSTGSTSLITFTINKTGTLLYEYAITGTSGGTGGDMTVESNSMGSISGTQGNSGTIDVVAGQTVTLSFSGSELDTFKFVLYIT
jgi:hypothetical protein